MITQLGIHRVRNGDVTKGIEDLMGGDRADVMYSDPPWGEGNIKYWATMNKKMTGNVNEPAPLDVFLSSIFDIAKRYVSRYLLIEYGVRWRDDINTRAVAAGFTPRAVVEIFYSSQHLPLDLHVFTKGSQPLPQNYTHAIAGTSGYATLKAALGPLAPLLAAGGGRAPIILDPCCGMGFTAQAAIDYGFAFRGNELNSARLAKTIARFK